MKKYKIAVIPGDGIGPEVCSESVKVLEHVAAADESFSYFPVHLIGGDHPSGEGPYISCDAKNGRPVFRYENNRINP